MFLMLQGCRSPTTPYHNWQVRIVLTCQPNWWPAHEGLYTLCSSHVLLGLLHRRAGPGRRANSCWDQPKIALCWQHYKRRHLKLILFIKQFRFVGTFKIDVLYTYLNARNAQPQWTLLRIMFEKRWPPFEFQGILMFASVAFEYLQNWLAHVDHACWRCMSAEDWSRQARACWMQE